jgi:hypothetical protein
MARIDWARESEDGHAGRAVRTGERVGFGGQAVR